MTIERTIEKAIEVCRESKFATVNLHPQYGKDPMEDVREICQRLGFKYNPTYPASWKLDEDGYFGVTIFDDYKEVKEDGQNTGPIAEHVEEGDRKDGEGEGSAEG